ncbi:DUF5597 domain-containing protein [Kitasatospora cineracea]|uniref:Glycosyl hydrolase family 35 n=1 Tax=Kitasatospora cineracea TaxID=88074 RepID=A0A8G1UP97_9ACTN|nr:DUF5597 domain-containing protein [Kitasatospora cineracea]ROR46544.1 glycosyl hydrolase family 35 [Kitasatospora cineracea]
MKDHLIDRTTGQLLVNGEPYLIRGVELHNSTSSDATYLQPLWERCRLAGANTVLAPVSWELLEPSEGEFDFDLVNAMLAGARSQGLKLVLLWFGSWKNGSSSYAPAWVKLDPSRFPLQTDETGQALNNLSPFSAANRDADATAFAALMAHLARVDGSTRTVIMVQVENEAGLLGAARSHAADAESAWQSPVPDALLEALRAGASPHVDAPATADAPTWDGLVGNAGRKAELFMAWHYAAYVEHVAAAGRERYDIPLFVNAWLEAPAPEETSPEGSVFAGGDEPGTFPSGGPLPQVSAAWKLAAPSIDLLAPDVYFGDFELPFKAYAETNPALFVPEIRADSHGVSYSFLAIGAYGAIGVAPFGFESLGEEETRDLRRTYGQLALLEQEVLTAQAQDTVRGFRVAADDEEVVGLGPYEFLVRAHAPGGGGEPLGYGLLLQHDEHTFTAVGHGFTALPRLRNGRPAAVLQADELVPVDGQLVPQRRLNGDETGSGTLIRISDTAPVHAFMPISRAVSGIVRFSVYSLPTHHDRSQD